MSTSILCLYPTEVDPSIDCRVLCRDNEAIKFENTLAIYQGKLLQPEKTYCYVPPGGSETKPPEPRSDVDDAVRCSHYAGILAWISNRQRWICHCTYPFLFKGPHCTDNRACQYEPLKHRENPNWENEVYLIDETHQSTRIITHSDLVKSSLFKTLNRANYKEYKKHINDPHYFLKNRISCSCDEQLDYLGNPLLDQRKLNRDFLDFTKCHVNPCKLTVVDDKVVIYDPVKYICNPADLEIHDNVTMGDRSTPFAGEVPLFGLRKRKVEPEATSGEFKNTEGGLSEKVGQKIASMVGPVITPKNTDHSDTSKYVMYFSPDQLNLAGKTRVDLRQYYAVPETYGQYGDSLPNLTNRVINAMTAYYVHPVENVLANNTPQNPVDFNLLAAQAMENSFMISGMVLGGHEVLFHSIFDEIIRNKNIESQKMSDMFNFFKTTRLEVNKVMTSIRLSKRRAAPVFRAKMSSLCVDMYRHMQRMPYARKLNAAASTRSYRTYGLLDSLSNLDQNYDIRELTTKQNMAVQLLFPTSLYKLNEDAHFYRDESKMISNQLEFSILSEKSSKSIFNLSFSSARRMRGVEHRQHADLWVPNDMCLNPLVRMKGELFDRHLAINEKVTPSQQSEFFNNLRKKRVRPLNLHHILAVSGDNFGESIINDPIITEHYMDASKIASSLTWNYTFSTKHFDETLVYERI